jgi:hypothetical protein
MRTTISLNNREDNKNNVPSAYFVVKQEYIFYCSDKYTVYPGVNAEMYDKI